MSLGAEQDHEEENGSEDPQGDGHKHHPAVCRPHSVEGAGYQRPLDQPRELEGRENKTKPG